MILCVAAENCLFSIADGPPTVPQVKGGKVRALAVTGAERSPRIAGRAQAWRNPASPRSTPSCGAASSRNAKTPPAIAKKLETALRQAIRDPDVSAKLKTMAVNPGGTSSDEFRTMIDADIKTYVEVVKAANLNFEE